jgi:cytochrome c oxidase subunit 3
MEDSSEDRVNLKARKFLMWLVVISSSMLFAGWTSGFMVYAAGSADQGLKVILPDVFKYSTAAMIVSSITMHMAYLSAKRLQFDKQKIYLIFTILLGLLFFVLQVLAWRTLTEQGVFLVNYNASQSFIYIFTGAHLAHIIAGIGALVNALTGRLKNIAQVKNLYRLEMASIFWHFIDIVWIYLYVFLLLNQ